MLNSIYQFLDTCPAWLFWGCLVCVIVITTILTTVVVRGLIELGRSLAAMEEASEDEQGRFTDH